MKEKTRKIIMYALIALLALSLILNIYLMIQGSQATPPLNGFGDWF